MGSQAVLADANGAKPSLLLDAEGDYVVRLVVNDGVKDSEPAYVTVTPVVPATTGPVFKFVLTETTPTPETNRLGQYTFCAFRGAEGPARDFWPVGIDTRYCWIYPGLESSGSSGLGSFAGFTPDSLPHFLKTSLGMPALGTFPADMPATPVSTSYEILPVVTEIARTPLGKSVGESVSFSLEGVRRRDGKVRYRIAGTVLPGNAPEGWEAAVQVTARIRVIAYKLNTFIANVDTYSKQFTTDFSEDVELALDVRAYEAQAPGVTQITYALEVTQQVAYSRKKP